MALLAHDPTTGAATRVVAVAGLEAGEAVLSWVPLEHLAAIDWHERVARAECLPDALAHWAESANGATFDVVELEAPSSADLRGAVEIVVDELLAEGDHDAAAQRSSPMRSSHG